jgi:DNA-directed RNA polymerase subunit D
MKIEKLDFSGDKASIIFSGADVHQVNALRRSLIVNVPKLAIDKVEIHLGTISDEDGRTYESTTPLFDEIIAHRLGLIPIPTDPGMFTYQKDCSCEGEGCSDCEVMYSLNKRGPCTVYSRDLDPLGDETLRPKDGDIPIVKLTEDEGILIYAHALLGTGREHAKWQPTQGVGYKPIPNIMINSKKFEEYEKCAEACPTGVFKKGKKDIKVAFPENCTLCMSCVEACEPGAITVDPDTGRYLFRFETDGSLAPKVALDHALETLEALYTDFLDSVGKLK